MIKNLAMIAVCGFALSACATSQLSSPSQPTPASLQAVNVQLASLQSTPAMTWKIGDYSVRAACHAYLNSAAQQSANLSFASTAVGLSGAAGSLINPAAGIAASLTQSFLNAFNSSGAIPYTPETSIIIMNSLDALESGVNPAAITDQATAISLVDDLWFRCSPGGYAMTVAQAITTAQIGVSNGMNSGQFGARALLAPANPGFIRPVITVNGR